MLQHLKKWWASYATVIGAVADFLDPSVQHWIGGHPAYAVIGATVWSLLLHQMQSPTQKPPVP